MKPFLQPLTAAGLLLFLAGAVSNAQPQLQVPDASPRASLSQSIGVSEVTISYHRPGVKGRPVWGSLVPMGAVWRAGANENTAISFSTAVTVGGKSLAAGTYGLHMIPTQGDWTISFSRNATSWGSFFYKEGEDAIRITVKPLPSEHHEWLQYEFSDLSDSSATLSLLWEKLRVSIPLAFATKQLVLESIHNAYLRGLAGFTWQGYNQAAQYCLVNGINLPEALTWADESIRRAETFNNLRTKADILEKMGKAGEAAPLRAKAMTIANEAEINTLGYTYLQANKMKEAIATFEKNVKDHPNSWNVYDSLAEGLEKNGDIKRSIANYEKALKLVGDDANRKRITDTIARLKAK